MAFLAPILALSERQPVMGAEFLHALISLVSKSNSGSAAAQSVELRR
jgi:hypothetical protein